jgi:hypothetical protein
MASLKMIVRFWTLLETESDLEFYVSRFPLFQYLFSSGDLELCALRVWRWRTTPGVTAFYFFPFCRLIRLHQMDS